MSFWDHLRELRGHLVRSFVAIILLAIVAFINKDFVFNHIILAPKEADFITNQWLCQLGMFFNIDYFCVSDFSLKIININMAGQFMTHLYISFMAGVVLAAPYIIYQFWSFIEPALYEHEKKNTGSTVLVCSFLFLTGVAFSYFLIVPLALTFFGSYHVSAEVANQIALGSYISMVVTVTISIGVVFELPVVIFFLTKAGLVSVDFLKANRKYMLVIILVMSAIITPPDVFSQVMVTLPLMVLYEFSILMAKRALKKKKTV
ncbi:MAG: twin-arginine translocase subunit TatC [Bacteroidetes bacterium 4572_77]|nr:MAG: twin-arginine translocase subunit TatC [Bacteroidetes bacterium 4572_77]